MLRVQSQNFSPIVFKMTLKATLNVTALWLGLRVFVGSVIGHMNLQFTSSMQLDRGCLRQRSIKEAKQNNTYNTRQNYKIWYI